MPTRDRCILDLARSIQTAANAGLASGQLDGCYVVGIASDADQLAEILEAAVKRTRKPTATKAGKKPSRPRSARRRT